MISGARFRLTGDRLGDDGPDDGDGGDGPPRGDGGHDGATASCLGVLGAERGLWPECKEMTLP
eukprot:9363740-Pyramimonas_sp.AAC.1